MIAFFSIATLMVLLALGFILWPLLKKEEIPTADAQALRNQVNLTVLRDQQRELDADLAAGTIDQASYIASKHDLERRVLEDVRPTRTTSNAKPTGRLAAVALTIAVPALAIGLYAMLGSPAALDPAKLVAAPQNGVTREQVVAMIEKLAKKLQSTPDDITGWAMLGRSYNALERYPEALQAYQHVMELSPDNPDVIADYAEMLAMTRNRSLQGEPEALIKKVLSLNPQHAKGLALSGSAAFEQHNYALAIAQWKKLAAVTPPESEMAQSIVASIAEAEKQAQAEGKPVSEGPVPQQPTASAKSTAPIASSKTVSGTVSLDPALKAQVADTDTVFIYARAAQGPRFPLAVLRKQVKDLPITFSLDDSMSMMPDAKLSGFPSVIVGARISKTGNAIASAGDYEGITEPLPPGTQDIKIIINRQH